MRTCCGPACCSEEMNFRAFRRRFQLLQRSFLDFFLSGDDWTWSMEKSGHVPQSRLKRSNPKTTSSLGRWLCSYTGCASCSQVLVCAICTYRVPSVHWIRRTEFIERQDLFFLSIEFRLPSRCPRRERACWRVHSQNSPAHPTSHAGSAPTTGTLRSADGEPTATK